MDMYYEVEGTGPPLLLIMGTAASHEVWAAQVDAYRDTYTVITYDARGTGQSTHSEDPTSYTMSSLADDGACTRSIPRMRTRTSLRTLARFGNRPGVRHQPPPTSC